MDVKIVAVVVIVFALIAMYFMKKKNKSIFSAEPLPSNGNNLYECLYNCPKDPDRQSPIHSCVRKCYRSHGDDIPAGGGAPAGQPQKTCKDNCTKVCNKQCGTNSSCLSKCQSECYCENFTMGESLEGHGYLGNDGCAQKCLGIKPGYRQENCINVCGGYLKLAKEYDCMKGDINTVCTSTGYDNYYPDDDHNPNKPIMHVKNEVSPTLFSIPESYMF